MKDWLDFMLCLGVAVWVLWAGGLALWRRRPRPPRETGRPPGPSGQGLRGAARLLDHTGTSTYARDQVQERLRILAEDLAALEGEHPGPDLLAREEDLAAFFAEDHVGFKGSAGRKLSLDPSFLQRTEAVVRRLEARAHERQGGTP